MQLLSMVLQHETMNKLIIDARNVANNNEIKNKEQLSNIMENNIPYWRSEVVGNNPIQEAVVLDSLWRILKSIPQFTGLYD